ncbi:4'-phosphopantetheinyl transferase family protein [Algoriphagus antarcticus]|uniref:4'-phosphopantetheinyl transferase n=1 Tax=Algoriphagus antarcticus TaxID=238540 RepID=A0A3E0D2K0_9BACT|nr:4'-phosphopantetheinyl transferase superfamily protein [Algoriphagus antarcticus]REG76919.1 4'-phosphopantetheinyl transferase [Algoriphagus antarcticus]
MVFGRIFCSQLNVLEWRKECDFELRNNLDVWRIFIPDFIGRITDEIHLVNDKELSKSDSFIQEEDKIRFLLGKIYLRKILSSYLKIAPEEVVFSFTEFNKPYLDAYPNLNFNLSHSGDYVIIGLSNRWSVGVDIEVMNTKNDLFSMIYNTMSVVEVPSILNSDTPRLMFYKHWTRKEALLKGVGIGLIDDLKGFSVCDGFNFVPSELSNFTSTLNVRNFIMDDEYSVSIAYDTTIRVIRFYEFNTV